MLTQEIKKTNFNEIYFLSQFFERKIYRAVAMDHSNNDCSASGIGSASFDLKNETLISTQTINLVTPSIPQISNNILHASVETTAKECDNLSYCKQAHDDGACSNDNFDLSVDNSSDFFDSAEKDDAYVQHALVTPDRVEEQKS